MATLDHLGGDLPWKVRKNCVWHATMTADIDGTPVNLTSITISARITASRTSTTALKTFTVTKDNAAAGIFTISIAEADANLDTGTYWWALEWDSGTGDEPLASGPFLIEPWVVV